MIFVIGGTLAFFFDILLLTKKNKSLPDKILTVWMFILGLHLFLVYFTDTGLDFKYPHLLGIQQPFPFLHCPMFYMYTAALTNHIKKIKIIHLLHLIPFLTFYIYYAELIFAEPEVKIRFVKGIISGEKDFYIRYSYPVMIILVAIYFTFTFLLFRKHKKIIKDYYSYSNEKINLNWLKYLLIGMLIVWTVVIIVNFIYYDIDTGRPIYVSVVLFVMFIGFFGIRQGNIFVSHASESRKEINNKADKKPKRYLKSGLKDNEAEDIQNQLTILMKEDKLYLDSALSLSKLAKQLGVLPNYLSQVINERIGKNFYDYVNFYRIEEFKKLVKLPENKKLTLLALAYESGFSSKAAFNNSFKKFMGQNPSEYVKSLKSN